MLNNTLSCKTVSCPYSIVVSVSLCLFFSLSLPPSPTLTLTRAVTDKFAERSRHHTLAESRLDALQGYTPVCSGSCSNWTVGKNPFSHRVISMRAIWHFEQDPHKSTHTHTHHNTHTHAQHPHNEDLLTDESLNMPCCFETH